MGLYNLAIVVTVSFINALGTNAINARLYALERGADGPGHRPGARRGAGQRDGGGLGRR
ncbi:hypothetical protein [Salana multivorans]